MKKIIVPSLIGLMILTICNISFATTAKVKATAVRIRESASTDSNIVTNAYQNDTLEILEEAGDWYKVKYGNATGYAKAEFFTTNGETVASQPSNTTENTVSNQEETNTEIAENLVENQASVEQNVVPNENVQETTIAKEVTVGENVVLSNTVSVRVTPTLSAIAKTEIAQGTNVIIQNQLGNWCKIANSEGNVSGWVIKSKLTTTSEPEVQQTEPTEPENASQNQTEEPITTQNTAPEQNVVPEQTAEPTPEVPEPEETTLNKTAVVTVETARVRKKASTTSDIIGVLDENDVITITAEEGDFYKITSEEVKEGYISKSLVKEKDVTSRGSTEERENTVSLEANEALNQSLSEGTASSVIGSDVVAFAKQYLGYPYVLGASSPENGFDCSGFTRYVFGHFGYTLGNVAASQTSVGSVVERENLQAGDLLLFYNDGKTKIGHCGIYIEGGDFIHSANPQRGVVIDNLNTSSYYSERFVTARRIVEK